VHQEEHNFAAESKKTGGCSQRTGVAWGQNLLVLHTVLLLRKVKLTWSGLRKKRSSDGSRPVMKTYAGGATTVRKDKDLMSSSIEELKSPETRMPSTAMNPGFVA